MHKIKIEVKYFGLIAEVINCSSELFEIEVDTELNLRDFFEIKYLTIKDLDYKIAINQQLNDFINRNQNNAEVALLPPFAGG